jgi:uncharacterized coiled-coil protein SlyX
MDDRLIELETRYTHLERQVADLSEVVFEQQKALELLRKQLLALDARLDQQEGPAPNDQPPHY